MGRKLDPIRPGGHELTMFCCRIIVSLALGLSASIATTAAMADQPIMMKTLDVAASIPAPPWTKTALLTRETETAFDRRLTDRGTDSYQRAYVPKGQTFEDWDERYEVRAEAPLKGNAQDHRDDTARAYQVACLNAIMAPVQQSDDRQVFVLFCPAFLDDPATGEIAVMVYSKRKDTLLQVAYKRRVPSFDVNNSAEFPPPEADMKQLVQYLNQARMIPS